MQANDFLIFLNTKVIFGDVYMQAKLLIPAMLCEQFERFQYSWTNNENNDDGFSRRTLGAPNSFMCPTFYHHSILSKILINIGTYIWFLLKSSKIDIDLFFCNGISFGKVLTYPFKVYNFL